jgi:phosphoenolpyruvate carboxylase
MKKMYRTIPSTMATQHPDNAFPAYWDETQEPFIGVHKEIIECVICFEDLDVGEFMWDWEGKHADAAVIDRLFTGYYKYFAEHQLGRDKYLTFRLPNIWEEKGYSLLQAMTVILTSEDFAKDLKFANRPLFEVILPMTERADQLMQMHTLFEKLAHFKSSEFSANLEPNTEMLELIPLVESVESQLNIRSLLEEYVALYKEHFKTTPDYIRPFMARSDPALVSGLLATVIANKIALSQVYEFSTASSIPVFPISGVGSLPFRGGLSPNTVDSYLKEYPGMRTVSVQSSFRYDHPRQVVKKAIEQLDNHLPKSKPRIIPADIQMRLAEIGEKAAKYYQSTLNKIAPDVQPVFAAVPRRRDRRQHIGLLSYGRSLGTQKLPRAITFTAGFYSLGVPPEFIGIGRTLSKLSAQDLELLKTEYSALTDDLLTAGRYLNIDNLALLAQRNAGWKDVQEDIRLAEEVLGVKFHPITHIEKAHKNLSSNALLFKNNKQALGEHINEMARLRKSLG